MKIILMLLGLMLTACAGQGGGSSPGSTTPADPAVVDEKACDSPISRAWSHDVNRISYEFGRNCTGKIPTCGQTYTYKLNYGTDRYRGTMDLVIAEPSIPGNSCETAGTATCTWNYDSGGTRKLYIRCPGYSTVSFTASHGVDY